jgi:5-carboxymethyl-2-hydroxymuconate isomerase
MGAGRTPEEKQKVGDELFAMLKEHFAELFARRGLALSMEIVELRKPAPGSTTTSTPATRKAERRHKEKPTC